MANDLEVIGIKIDQLLEYNKRQDTRIGTIHKILTGNGEPEEGMVVKYARLSEVVEGIKKTLNQHWAILIGVSMTVIGAVIKVVAFK